MNRSDKIKGLLLFFATLLFVLYSSVLGAYAVGNANTNKTFVQGAYHRGILFPHHDYIQFFNEDFINGFELRFGKTQPHIKQLNPPTIGVGIYHSNMGNQTIYGNATGVFFYFESCYYANNTLSIGTSVSSGVSYLSKTYHKLENPHNQAIGSSLNALFILSLDLNFNITPDFGLSVSPSMVHVSNGKVKLPNTGLNLHTLRLGLRYKLREDKITSKQEFVSQSNNNITGVYSFGVREYSKRSPIKQFVSTAVIDYHYTLSSNSRLGVGANLFFLNTMESSVYEPEEPTSQVTSGLHASYEIVWAQLSFILQPGLEHIPNKQKDIRHFTRVGIRYRLSNSLLINCSLKSTYFVAEFIEWGIGYNLNFPRQ